MDTPTKRCTKCGRELPRTLDYFYREPRVKDGLATYCKTCVKLLAKAWQQANPARMAANRERYLLTHREQIRTHQRRYRANNLERVRALEKAYRERCKARDAGE